MIYAAYVSCTRCSGNHSLSQCPLPAIFNTLQHTRENLMTYQMRKEGSSEDWHVCLGPLNQMEAGYVYRILPKPPAPKWPQTTMTDEEMNAAANSAPLGREVIYVANAAIAHACESGALVPIEKVREIEAKAGELGMNEGSRRDVDRDRMVARTAISTALHSRGLVWDSSELDRIMEFIKK